MEQLDPTMEQPPVDQDMDLGDLLGEPPPQFRTSTPQTPPPRNTGAPTSSLWDSVWGVASKTAGSVARGVMEGMNEASNTVAGAALAISKGTGAYKLGRSPEERAEWLKNYEKPTENINPFQWSEEVVEGLAGPKQSGLYGVVSGISQFAVGMVGASRYLKALGITAPATTGARIGFEAAKGGLVDATFFKANADRLSDAVKGTMLENPISNLLESDEDDTELEGRVKNVAEGMLLGTTIDLLVAGTKAMRAARNGNMQEASRILDEATVAAETPKPTDVVMVREVDDGVEVVPVNVVAEATADAAPTAAKFATREEAETVAAGMNYVNKTVNHGVSVDEWANAVDVPRWAEAKRAYDDGLDPRDAAQILDNTGLNIKYDTSPDEVINVVKALADTHLEPLEIARGRPEAWAETAEKAKQMATDLGIDEDPTRAVAQAAAVFGDTDNLAARLYMLRVVRAKLADDVAKVSRAADLNPEDGDLMLALEQGLNRLNALHVYLSGSVSNTARALRQQAMDAGTLAGRTADEVATEAPEVAKRKKAATEALEKARQAKKEAADARKSKAEAQAKSDADRPAKSGKTAGSQLRDTDGLTASEWSQYRAVKQALKAIGLAEKIPKPLDEAVEAMASMKRTRDVLKAQSMDAEVGPDILEMAKANSKQAVNPTEELSKWMDAAEDALDNSLAPKPPKEQFSQRSNITPMDQLLEREAGTESTERFAWSQRVPQPKRDPGGNPADRLMDLLNKAEDALEKELNPDRGNLGTSRSGPITPMDQLLRANVLKGLTAQEIRDLARSVFMTDGDPAKMMRVLLGLEQTKKAKVAVPQTQYQRVRDFALTWRMESMLSAPTTHVGNIVSNSMVMMQRPVEYWWAGVRSNDASLRDFAVDMVKPMALWHDVQDAMAAMSKAFKTGLNVLDPQAPDRVGGLQEIGAGDGKPFGNALHVLGRLPSRALMSADEFFKQMNYRMNVRAQILRKARESGITDAVELQQRLKDQSKWNFAPDGAAANPWALDYARVSTFTNDLGAGTIGQSIQNLANEHPLFRVIMPFVKTPINIFRFAAERTPVINMATAEWKAAMKSGDPERIALAKAKAEFGALFWSAGAILAYNKVITGGGPSDPGLRRQLQQAGWQPYSIRVGDRYVSYRKADPVLTAFSLVSDAIEMSGELDERDLGDIATVAMASVASSVTSKSFMQGVSDFFDMISSGREDKAQAFLENTVGSFIPNVLRKVDPNPYIMESRGFIEELKARIPGFSETLEPRRNLFGERIIRPPGYVGVDNVINPFTVSGKVEKPNVMNELVKLGKAMPVPEPVIRQGSNSIDLRDRDTFDDRRLPNGQTQSPYDRWLELIGETGLRSKLTAMVTDPDYQGLSEEDKLSWATGMVKAAQDEAKARMVQEYPQVQQALQMSNEIQGAIREGNAEAALDGVYQRFSKQFVKRKARPNVAMPE